MLMSSKKIHDEQEVYANMSSELATLASRIEETVEMIGTRAKAAEAAEITVQQLGRLISGKTTDPSARTLGRLAEAAGVSLDWLIRGVEPKRIPSGVFSMARFNVVRSGSMVEVQRALERDKARIERILGGGPACELNEMETSLGPGEVIRGTVERLREDYAAAGVPLDDQKFSEFVSDAQDRVLELAVIPEQWLQAAELIVWEHQYALALLKPPPPKAPKR